MAGNVSSHFYEFSEWSDSPYINHFLQPDTIIPNQANPQSWNRYSYVQNRPVSFNDPTGHWVNETNDPIQEQLKIAQKDAKERRDRNKKKDKDSITDIVDLLIPDATYRSWNYAVGISEDLFWTGGFTAYYVPKQKEWAIFGWYKSGAYENVIGTSPDFGFDEDELLFSPQIGLTVAHGFLWGEKINREGVDAFIGHSGVFDAMAGSPAGPGAGFEFTQSIDEQGNRTEDYFGAGAAVGVAGRPSFSLSNVSTYLPAGQPIRAEGTTAQILNFVSYLLLP